ncbi:hypothetical protein CTH30272_03078 [Allocatenococcus thiocycli]|nr:hypothetical protein CTH30272_03078 [Catenococcus thiocycli]
MVSRLNYATKPENGDEKEDLWLDSISAYFGMHSEYCRFEFDIVDFFEFWRDKKTNKKDWEKRKEAQRAVDKYVPMVRNKIPTHGYEYITPSGSIKKGVKPLFADIAVISTNVEVDGIAQTNQVLRVDINPQMMQFFVYYSSIFKRKGFSSIPVSMLLGKSDIATTFLTVILRRYIKSRSDYVDFKVEELMTLCGYPELEFKKFNQRIIQKSIEEINKADSGIKIEEIKEERVKRGKSIFALKFKVETMGSKGSVDLQSPPDIKGAKATKGSSSTDDASKDFSKFLSEAEIKNELTDEEFEQKIESGELW